jgi:hypothetical protein
MDILANINELPLVKITGSETDLKQYRILCGSALCAVIDEKKMSLWLNQKMLCI